MIDFLEDGITAAIVFVLVPVVLLLLLFFVLELVSFKVLIVAQAVADTLFSVLSSNVGGIAKIGFLCSFSAVVISCWDGVDNVGIAGIALQR